MDEGPTREYRDLLDIIRSFQRSRAVTVAAELGIADLLRDGPRDAVDLAVATGTHAASLYRLLRALATIGIFTEGADGRFAMNAMGQYLRRDHPLSADPAARMFGAGYEWRAWAELAHSVRTGENAATHALGCDVWEHRRRHPEDGEVFDATMCTFSRADSANVLAAHDFGRYPTVADVGGGTGAALAAVLVAHPAARGILFDRSHVVAGADAVFHDAGVAERVTVVAGDFFAEVPPGADAYVLTRILHDWPDEDAVRILHRVRAAMAPRRAAAPRGGGGGSAERGHVGEVPRSDDARLRGRPGAHRGRVAGPARRRWSGARRHHPRDRDQARDRGCAARGGAAEHALRGSVAASCAELPTGKESVFSRVR
ncbi:methyltransferase [Pseudonocardia sichuanensis]